MTEDVFDRAVARALDVLGKYISRDIIGYHAPDFSLSRRTPWVFDVLIKRGFKYDCSIFPIKHPNYGMPDFSRHPVFIRDQILEIPMPTLRIFGKNIPFGGGGYLRHLPYWMNGFSFVVYNRGGHSALTYVHPWEFENAKDLMDVFDLRNISWLKKWRYFGNCGDVFSSKFERLIRDFMFVPVEEIYREFMDTKKR